MKDVEVIKAVSFRIKFSSSRRYSKEYIILSMFYHPVNPVSDSLI